MPVIDSIVWRSVNDPHTRWGGGPTGARVVQAHMLAGETRAPETSWIKANGRAQGGFEIPTMSNLRKA